MNDIRRDRWGRPLVPSPLPDGELTPHARPSSIAMKIADRFNLERWQMRMVAKGVAMRDDLIAKAHAADPDVDKRDLDDIAKEAKEAAGSLKGANLGTALHAYTRRINAGETVDVLEQHQPAIDAYRRCIEAHSIEPATDLLEQFVVWSEMLIAGSCDLFADYGGRLVVMDLKTGQHDPTSFSMVEQAAQFACYANATHIWDGHTATPLPEVDTDIGYLIWMPSGGDRCELIEVDIAKGRRWVELAAEVAEAHKDKNVGRHIAAPDVAPASEGATTGPAAQVPTAPATVAPSSFRDPIRDGIVRCQQRIAAMLQAGIDAGHIHQMWPDDTPKLSEGPEHHTAASLDAIAATLMLLEAEAGLAPAERSTVEQATQRIEQLPAGVATELDLAAKRLDPPIPNLKTKVTDADLDRLADLLDVAEQQTRPALALALHGLNPSEQRAIVDWATEPDDNVDIDDLDGFAAERVAGLAHLYHRRGIDRDQLLIDVHGSKAEALAAARTAAKRHGMDAPKSTADVAANRVLCGLVTHPQRGNSNDS